MSEPQDNTIAIVSVDKIQREWQDLKLRVAQLETGNAAMELEIKALRQVLERSVEYRKKSHGELITLLTTIVSKLPLNDVGVLVSRLMEHAQHVNEISAALIHGKSDDMLQPAVLKALDKTKSTLRDAIKPLVDELILLKSPFDHAMLQSLVEKPDIFFLPLNIRASRGFVKGQIPRERIMKEFGEETSVFFKDRTTDPKLNPRPKAEEIMVSFLPEFEELLKEHPNAGGAKRDELVSLFHRVRDGRNSRAQKIAFLKLSFILELLHYYENQSTVSPNEVFAQRMPPLIEQLVVTNENDPPDENLIKQAESLLALIISPDHRMAVVNNFGKTGGLSRTARFVLTFRALTFNEHDPVTLDFLKHLLSLNKVLQPSTFTLPLKLLNQDGQKAVLRCLINSGRVRREEAEPIAKAVMQELNLPETEVFPKTEGSTGAGVTGGGWDNIKLLIASRAAPNDITVAIRNRLHQKYDSDEVKQSWLVLAESDPMTLVRVFCLLPYLPDGQTDPIARPVLESFSNRLTHEKYTVIYNKVIGALKNLFKVKADSPALVNFVSIVKWVDPASAEKIARDIGMQGV